MRNVSPLPHYRNKNNPVNLDIYMKYKRKRREAKSVINRISRRKSSNNALPITSSKLKETKKKKNEMTRKKILAKIARRKRNSNLV